MNNSKYIYLNKTNGQRAGVLGVEQISETEFRLALSLCGGKDAFEPKTGVARALGRLKSPTQSRLVTVSGNFFLESELCILFKNAPWRTNPFNDVNWGEAQKKFVETFVNKRPRKTLEEKTIINEN